MRHSNQPSSSRVSRSTSREAPRVSDTRPEGRKGGVAEGSQRKGRRAEGGKVNAHNQTGVVSKCRARAHKAGVQASSVTKATVKVKDSTALTDKTLVTEHTNGRDMSGGAGESGGAPNT